jgi:hypothetical protein
VWYQRYPPLLSDMSSTVLPQLSHFCSAISYSPFS